MGILRQLNMQVDETARRVAFLEKFDVGVVPRLLRLAIAESKHAADVLQILLWMVHSAAEIAAEMRRSHLGALRYAGQHGEPREIALKAATAVETACLEG